jgi:hypothetical protein
MAHAQTRHFASDRLATAALRDSAGHGGMRPQTASYRPVREHDTPEYEPGRATRGILLGLLISTPLWIGIAALVF